MRSRLLKNGIDKIVASAFEFAELLRQAPFDNTNGLKPDGAFYLYYWVRELNPDFIVESGAWRGYSTWVLQKAAPTAKILSLDPIFALGDCLDHAKIGPTYRPAEVVRGSGDFSCTDLDFQNDVTPRSLVFFDDHQNKIHRLKQAIQKRFRHVIFDDNLPVQATHRTFFHYFQKPQTAAWLHKVIDSYEIFPPLWSTKAGGPERIWVEGLEILKDQHLAQLDTTRDERSGYTWLTYVKIKEEAIPAAGLF